MNKRGFFRHRNQSSLSIKIILVCVISLGSQLFSQPLADGHRKFLGNIISSSIPTNFDSYWNQVTPENSGKWGSVEIGRDTYQWGSLDMAYNYALDNDFPFKHHTLVWGQQEPWWIQNLDSLEQAQEVEEWIQLVAQRYPETYFVDVVNEPLFSHGAQPSYKEALGGDGQTGWDWVIWCFEKARQYFPEDTKLILNEYYILINNYNTSQLIPLINLLKERELIDAIGIEGHYKELKKETVEYMRNNLDKLAATGIPIYISEFDVNLADDDAQLQEYQKLFPFLWEYPAVEGITLWGYIQYQIWQTDGYLIRADGTERPALEWLRGYLTESGIKELTGSIPRDYILYQNYPNPFNPSTTIRYALPQPAKVKVTIHNILGVRVRTLVDSYQNIGEHSIAWDAKNDHNNPVSSGIYFYSITTNDVTLKKKMILMR